MKYKIDPSRRPLYMQIYGQLRDDIVNGIYPYNTKIPSKRLLSDECGVSTITVEHAYELLCDEGYIEARERSGYFVCFKPAYGFAVHASSAPSALPRTVAGAHSSDVLGSGALNYDLSNSVAASFASDSTSDITPFPFSVLAKTMRRVLSEHGERILKKAPNNGCIELRDAISRYLSRNRGMNVDPSRIIIGSGAEYLYGLIIELLGRDRTYGIEYPSYRKIEQVYSASEVIYELLPFERDGIDSRALSHSLATVLHTTPYRSFPTGVTASATKRHEYIRWAKECNGYIIEDDFESEFSVSSKPEDTLYSLSDDGNVIYLNTFSKTVSPSFRVGYMVLSDSLAHKFYEKLGFYSCTVPTFEQLVLAELINSGGFERHINKVRRSNRKSSLLK